MSFNTVCAILVNEPFNVPLHEIAQLTDYQINNIYFHPRTKEGAIDVYAHRPDPGQVDYEAEFRWSWQQKGATPEEIDAKWAEIQKNAPNG